MNSSNPAFSIGLTVVIIGLLVYRQIRPRRLSTRGLILMPIILLYFIVNAWHSFHPGSSQLTEIGISAVVSVVFGLLACRQLKVYAGPRTGKAMASGSWTYFLWWLGAITVKIGLAAAFGESLGSTNDVEILIPVLALVATRNAFLYWRVTEMGLELHGKHE